MSWERLEQGTPSEDLWALSEACRTPLPMQEHGFSDAYDKFQFLSRGRLIE